MMKHNPVQMEFTKEFEISKYQPVVFFKGTPMGDLYEAIVKDTHLNCGPFSASIFYNLGRVQGIREERARRKNK